MKLQLEFEPTDLQEMICEYFKARGFVVNDIEALVEKFNEVFPEGLSVSANPSTQDRAVPSAAAAPTTPTAVPALSTSAEPPAAGGNVVFSADDLMDPTPGKVPTRDEQLAATQLEVAAILAQSKALEEENQDV